MIPYCVSHPSRDLPEDVCFDAVVAAVGSFGCIVNPTYATSWPTETTDSRRGVQANRLWTWAGSGMIDVLLSGPKSWRPISTLQGMAGGLLNGLRQGSIQLLVGSGPKLARHLYTGKKNVQKN